MLAGKLEIDIVNGFSGCPGDQPNAKYPNWVIGKNGEDYVRISLLADTEKIKEAASRIEQSGVLNVRS